MKVVPSYRHFFFFFLLRSNLRNYRSCLSSAIGRLQPQSSSADGAKKICLDHTALRANDEPSYDSLSRSGRSLVQVGSRPAQARQDKDEPILAACHHGPPASLVRGSGFLGLGPRPNIASTILAGFAK